METVFWDIIQYHTGYRVDFEENPLKTTSLSIFLINVKGYRS